MGVSSKIYHIPGDSILGLFIPDRWRSPFQPLSSGHVNSPSQKGHDRRIARLILLLDIFSSRWREGRKSRIKIYGKTQSPIQQPMYPLPNNWLVRSFKKQQEKRIYSYVLHLLHLGINKITLQWVNRKVKCPDLYRKMTHYNLNSNQKNTNHQPPPPISCNVGPVEEVLHCPFQLITFRRGPPERFGGQRSFNPFSDDFYWTKSNPRAMYST